MSTLHHAIYQEKAVWYAYLAESEINDDAVMPREARQVLEEWDKPASDQFEALSALELALEQYEIGETPVIPAMIKAAIGYLKGANA